MDIRALMRDYRRHWYWFVISIFVCGLIGLFFISRKKDIYAVTATILIEEDKDSGGGGSTPEMSFNFSSMFSGGNGVDEEVFLVSSHNLFKDVARKLGLDKSYTRRDGIRLGTALHGDSPIEVVAPVNYADTTRHPVSFKVEVNSKGKVKVRMKDVREKAVLFEKENQTLPLTIDTRYGRFILTPTKYYNPSDPEITLYIGVNNYDSAAEDLSAEVQTGLAQKNTKVISITYETENPEFGKELINTIIALYNEQGLEHKNRRSEQTIRFLDDRINLLLGQIRKNDETTREFKEHNGLADVYAEAEYNMTLKGTVANELFQAETQLEIMKMAREFLNTPGNEYALVPYQNVSTANNPNANNGIDQLVSTYNKLVLERMQIASTAKTTNIALQKISEQLDALRANIIVTMNKVADGAEVSVRELRRQLGEAQGSLGKFPEQERQFLNISRDRQLLNALYSFLLQKREATALLLADTNPRGRIIDEAYTMRDSLSLSSKMIMAIALLCGLLIPMAVIYLMGLFRTKVVEREEIDKNTKVPVLGEICQSREGKALVVTPGNNTPTVELFRLIRTNLQFVLNGRDQKVVLVTSSRSGEGKSFIAVNTAAALAMTGKRVALVGMDIRRPRLGEELGIDNPQGLTNYLVDNSLKATDIVNAAPVGIDTLDVVLSGPVPPNPAELLLSKRVDELFAELRHHYDYIVVDSAPLGMVSDTFTLAHIADATIYVTRLNVTTKSDIATLNSIYAEQRLPRPGVVVNGTEAADRTYTYSGKDKKRKRSVFRRK